MIRLIQRRLIIPRGDTGTFSVPVLSSYNSGDAAVFSIIDPRTQSRVYNKLMYVTDNVISVRFEHGDTVNLPVGKFLWDIKFYQSPIIDEGQVVSGKEVDSYYAAFTMPACEIRQTGDNLLTADDAPGSTLTPQHINAINAALFALNEAVEKTETNVTHYPTIIGGEWNVWDANLGDYTTTGIEATGNGIASIEKTNTEGLVDTYTVNFTDGTTFLYNITNGDRGIGISSISKGSTSGLVDTYIIAYTDGTSTSFTVTNGAIPNISIGTVQEGPIAAASITGNAANPVLNLTLPNANVPTRLSQLENDADYVSDANYVHTDNNYTTAEKEKLSGIAAGAEVNVNADWNAISGDAQILNKPTKVSDFTNDAGYLSTESDPTVPAWAKAAQKPTYTAAEVGAPTVQEMNEAIAQIKGMNIHICAQGEYDINGVPTIQNPDTQTFYLVPSGEGNDMFVEWIYANNKWEIFGGAKVDLSDYALKSELPTKVSELSNDSGYLTSYTETDPTVPQWAKANTKPSYTATEVGALPSDTHIPSTTAELTNDAGFITSAALPTKVSDLTNDAGYLTSHQDISGKANSADLAAVATSGDYDDLINKPTIPTVPVQSVNGQTGAVVLDAQDIGAYEKPATGIPKTDLENAVQTTLDKADTALQSAPVTSVNTKTGAVVLTPSDIGAGTYSKPSDGIPASDLAAGVIPTVPVQDVQMNGTSVLNNGVANVPVTSTSSLGVVQIGAGLRVNSDGLVWTGMSSASEVKGGTSNYTLLAPNRQHESAFYGLAKAAGDSTQSSSSNTVGNYTDAAKSAIQHMLGTDTILAPYESDTTADAAYAIGAIFMLNGKLHKATAAIAIGDTFTVGTNCAVVSAAEVFPHDVQVNGTSVVQNGVANVPIASSSNLGVVKVGESMGIDNNGAIDFRPASGSDVIAATSTQRAITPKRQHEATFFGLAKAAGDTSQQSAGASSFGNYTESAKSAISEMLNGSVSVTGTTPTITALPGVRYVCGEVATLSFTPSATGICDVVFTSGSTATVLTVPNTVKWPAWFNPASLEANVTYEINILDGVYGVVGVWS